MTAAAPALPARSAGWSAADWTALLLCFALGALNLWNPFTYDQALFAMGGERLLEGGRIYQDFWDTKQPGIFWFFAAGIRLFGLSEEGVHLLELLWFTAFAATLIATLRREFDHRWGPAAAALCVVGFYWCVTRDWHQTQPEGLVSFPLYLSLWLTLHAARDPEARFGRWLMAGVAAGVVGVFKLLLVALPVLFAIAILGVRLRRPGGLARAGRALLALAAGFAIPIGAMLAALAAQGLLDEAWYTWVVFPRWVTGQIRGLPLRAWEESFHWFFERWTSLAALSFIGAWTSLRGRQAELARLLLLWIFAGFGLLLMQKFSGWEYHLMLFVVPLGLLAARGLDALYRPLAELRPPASPRERRWLLVLAALAVLANPISLAAVKLAELVKDRFVTTPAMRTRHLLRVSQGGGYYRFTEEGRFLREPGARPGPIYVIGNPLVCWLSGRRSSVPRLGGILFEHMRAEEWEDTARRLVATRTPYVFIEAPRLEHLEKQRPRSNSILETLANRYRERRTSRYGTWFEWNDAP